MRVIHLNTVRVVYYNLCFRDEWVSAWTFQLGCTSFPEAVLPRNTENTIYEKYTYYVKHIFESDIFILF